MNTILYIGLGVFLFGFIIFLISAIRIGQIDRHLHKQKQLHNSFVESKKKEKKQWQVK
tara:strand:- start:198 stop:371 length:174 start_codon:yes stop_codon:yes gene_type:complete